MANQKEKLDIRTKIAVATLAVAIIGLGYNVFFGGNSDTSMTKIGDEIALENTSGVNMINTGSGDQTNVQIQPMYDLEGFQEQAAKANPELRNVFDYQEYIKQDRPLMEGFRVEAHEFRVGCRPGKEQLSASECKEYLDNTTKLYVDRVELFNSNRHLMDDLEARQQCLYIRGFWRDLENQWNIPRPVEIKC